MTLIRQAINRLVASGLSSSDIADALGITNAELRNLRAAKFLSPIDEPPVEWYHTLAELAWQKGGLERLAQELDTL